MQPLNFIYRLIRDKWFKLLYLFFISFVIYLVNVFIGVFDEASNDKINFLCFLEKTIVLLQATIYANGVKFEQIFPSKSSDYQFFYGARKEYCANEATNQKDDGG